MKLISIIRKPLTLLGIVFFSNVCTSQVRINEIMASPSERVFKWNEGGTPTIGITKSQWWDVDFDDTYWPMGAAPLGMGYPDVNTVIQFGSTIRPSFYARKSFEVSAAQAINPGLLSLDIAYNDGIIVFINGTEVSRRNLGPKGLPVFHDQGAYNEHNDINPETISLNPASNLLHKGNNTLSVIVHKWWHYDDDSLFLDAQLSIQNLATPLFSFNEEWKYFPGLIEPSGGVIDESFLLNDTSIFPPDWTFNGFDDSSWSIGPGPLGFDRNTDYALGTNLQSEMYGITPSLYMRTTFELSQSQLNNFETLETILDYDDGFALYLNGRELTRANISSTGSTAIPFDTTADQHNASNDGGSISDKTVTQTFDVSGLNLLAGTNVIAVQIHNSSSTSSDMIFSLEANATISGSTSNLITYSQNWSYFVGTQEPGLLPLPESAEMEEPDFKDWIELFNESASPVNLYGWSLSDDELKPKKWEFPQVILQAGDYLVILATGNSQKNTSAPRLHTNFKLTKDGEFLGLYNSSGTLISSLGESFPKQNAYHSYGYLTSTLDYRYFPSSTPGKANSPTGLFPKLKKPDINMDGGHYNAPISITLSSEESGVQIRYTLDGSLPTASSTRYVGLLSSTTIRQSASRYSGEFITLRAAAFKSGYISSDSITRTYLFNQPSVFKSLPTLAISGDDQRDLFRPFGTTAMDGHFEDNPETSWYDLYYTPSHHSQYSLITASGRPTDRPMSLEFITQDERGSKQTNVSARVSASGYSKPRVDFRNIESGFGLSNVNKPSLNIFWRDEVEKEEFDFQIFQDSKVTEFDTLRLRSGKNDDVNPFIRDELCRRIFLNMGQIGAVGVNTSVYVNGEFEGYFNLTERLRERFFQEWHKDPGPWFIKQVSDINQGDSNAYAQFVYYLNTTNFSTQENYSELVSQVDEVNVIDYLLVNAFTAMWDWPGNNYVLAKSDSPQGKYRFYMWDAEGSFGLYDNKPVNYDTFSEDLMYESSDPPSYFRALYQSPEFRLHFADRVYKHFFNRGAMTKQNWDDRHNELHYEIAPLIEYSTGNSMQTDWYTNWMSQRYPIFFNQLKTHGLWPDTKVPSSDTPEGNIASNTPIQLSTNGNPGIIYYTLNGTDPRGYGGTIEGLKYNSQITFKKSTALKARVLSGAEWSPLLELEYTTGHLPTIEVTEIMYNPKNTDTADESDLEFIELYNPNTDTLLLNGLQFIDGIDYTFPENTSLRARKRLILVSDTTAFTNKYPGVVVFGEYNGQLANGGESLNLSTLGGQTVFEFEYNDSESWAQSADGDGFSLVPNLGGNPDPNNANHWRASAFTDGSPGKADPPPLINPILINEVLTHTDLPDLDSVEIHNPNSNVEDISYWFLSDDPDDPKKYQFPSGSTLLANGYLFLDETDFGPNTLGDRGFRLNSLGETLLLYSANYSNVLTGYIHSIELPASENGISFNRFQLPDGDETWFPSETNTLGSANSEAKAPEVIISEILYSPTTGTPEFIEIVSLSDSVTQLYDPLNPNNTWQISGINYYFPEGASINPGQIGLIVPIDPATYRSLFEIPASVAIWGPFSGKLSNEGETVSIKWPDAPDTDPETGDPLVPYLLEDSVEYDDKAPWPKVAAENGYSLVRTHIPSLGMDVTNWDESSGRNGTPGLTGPLNWQFWNLLQFTEDERNNNPDTATMADFDKDSWINFLEYAFGLDVRSVDFVSPIQATNITENGISYAGITVRIRKDIEDIEWVAQISTDLVNWETTEIIQQGPDAINGDGTLTRIYRDTLALQGEERRFMRLRVKLKK